MQQHPAESRLSLWLQCPGKGGNAGGTAPLRSCLWGSWGTEMGLDLFFPPLQRTERTNFFHTDLLVVSWEAQSALHPQDLA